MKIIPFRWIAGEGASRQSAVNSQQSGVGIQQSADLQMIKEAVARAGTIVRWKNRCLVSSLAGRCMLRKRKIPSQLFLGVIKGADGKVLAHAWLESGDFEIVEKNGDYTELFLF